jgi:hypothetical protein
LLNISGMLFENRPHICISVYGTDVDQHKKNIKLRRR